MSGDNEQAVSLRHLVQPSGYERTRRRIPIITSHNLDFSSFPLLLERVYKQLTKMDPTFGGNIPFCAFQHVYVGILNALLLNRVHHWNTLILIPEDMCIPQPIANYYEHVAHLKWEEGGYCIALFRLNLPAAAVPQGSIPATGQRGAIPPGSFGPITEENHNAYECYVSPYITHRLIEETIDQKRRQRVVRNWQPLPAGTYPTGAVPNENLLGYRKKVERISDEALEFISRLTFAATDNIPGRLRWCPELVEQVSTHIRNIDDCRTVVGRPLENAMNTNFASLGVIYVHNTIKRRQDVRLSRYRGHLYSPVILDMSQCKIVSIFALKRKRSAKATGVCYTTLGKCPRHWNSYINVNYNMRGLFQTNIAESSRDKRLLREFSHDITAVSTRDKEISGWVHETLPFSESEDSDDSEDSE